MPAISAIYRGELKIPLPLDSPSLTTLMWHHTDANGLKGILESNRLWASSPLTLNDYMELSYGKAILRDEWAKLQKSDLVSEIQAQIGDLLDGLVAYAASHVYVLCATLEKDSLNQWMHYSGRTGYAIGLDTRGGLAVTTSTSAEAALQFPLLTNFWFKVVYDEQEQREAAREILRFVAKHALPDQRELALSILGSLICMMKHEGFKDEREVRYLAPSPAKFSPIDIKYRTNSRGLVPYVELAATPPDTKEYIDYFVLERDSSLKLPIKEVRVGPVPEDEREAVREMAADFLATRGYSAKVTASTIPYRF